MKKVISMVFLASLLVISILNADLTGIASFGAPPSSTGAPGEITCAESGCHDDGPLPTRNMHHRLTIERVNKVLNTIDSTRITIHVTDANIQRFGFQLTALDAHGNSVGTFVITDPIHTQILQNRLELTDRSYVTYTQDGTLAKKIGEHTWECLWIAPTNHQGPVSFYLATVSANDDNRDKGDRVYITDTTLYVQKTTGISQQSEVECTKLGNVMRFVNPGASTLYKVIAIDGSVIDKHNAEYGETQFDFTSLPKGFYVMQSKNNIFPFIR